MQENRRWRDSLYSRAFLFTIVGSGSLLGAVIVQSWIMVGGTVDRLLQERISLARSTGGYLEQVIEHDLDQLGDAAASIMKQGAAEGELRPAVALAYSGTMFQEGAFILDKTGRPLVTVPEARPDPVLHNASFKTLVAKARGQQGPVSSNLVRLRAGNRPVLIMLKALRGNEQRVLGYIGGFLHPASNNLLGPFKNTESGTTSTLQLIDQDGTVIASTRPESLFRPTDHGKLLSNAILHNREIHGRCHSCHQISESRTSRESEVLAFAPLPRLGLGMAVRQPEKEALAPAFMLQRRLIVLGIAFVFLFLIFTALSVHSVVSPLRRLTRAVRGLEKLGLQGSLPSFGRDEVGELARALERWRSRVIESLAALEKQEAALQQEVTMTQRHLAALQEISEYGSTDMGMEALLQNGLRKMLEFLGLSRAAVRLNYSAKQYSASIGLSPSEGEALLNKLPALLENAVKPELASSALGSVRTRVVDATELSIAPELRPIVIADLRVPQGLHLECALSEETPASGPKAPSREKRRIQSLLHQLLMSAANRLLHEQDVIRHKQSREFLQKVLSAQEDERRRIARELHDTIAQDLSAHRLEIERLSNQLTSETPAPEHAARLRQLETKVQEMLAGLRQMLLDLRPSVLDTMGFLPALQWYLERVQRDHGINARLSVENDEIALDSEMQVSLFRIFQEALQNVVQHAEAEHVLVTISQTSLTFEMAMEDDGKGFHFTSLSARTIHPEAEGYGLGILGMYERSSLMGGEMILNSKPGEGTTLTIRVPILERSG